MLCNNSLVSLFLKRSSKKYRLIQILLKYSRIYLTFEGKKFINWVIMVLYKLSHKPFYQTLAKQPKFQEISGKTLYISKLITAFVFYYQSKFKTISFWDLWAMSACWASTMNKKLDRFIFQLKICLFRLFIYYITQIQISSFFNKTVGWLDHILKDHSLFHIHSLELVHTRSGHKLHHSEHHLELFEKI